MRKNKQQNDTNDNLLVRLWKGQMIPVHFFKNHWIGTLTVTGMLLMSIANKYSCQQKITEIKQLEKQLQVEQANRIVTSATYNSLIRESSMIHLVDTMHIDLVSPERPPYNLTKYE